MEGCEKMIIIVEGVDGQGKSFLCERLKKDFSAKLVHVSAPTTKNAFLEYVQLLNNVDPKKNYVFDRCFHGELAYGPVFRKRSMVNDVQLYYLETLALKNRVKCVYCWTDIENTREVFKTRGENFTGIDDVKILHMKFNSIIKKSSLEWSRYDWRSDSYASMVEKIWLKLDGVSVPGNHVLEFIGSRNPEVLLVGDKKNDNLKNLPVFCSTSGMFLMRSLKELNINFSIVNSIHLNEAINVLKPKKIVALGNKAWTNVLKYKNINKNLVCHPQYAKRFYGKNAQEIYFSELEDACLN